MRHRLERRAPTTLLACSTQPAVSGVSVPCGGADRPQVLAAVETIQYLHALAAEGGGDMLPDPLGAITDDQHPPQYGFLPAAIAAQAPPAYDVQCPTTRRFSAQTWRKADGRLARRHVARTAQLTVLPAAHQAQLDLVPFTLISVPSRWRSR